MTHYYRVPTPRHDARRPNPVAVGIVILLVSSMVIFLLGLMAYRQTKEIASKPVVTHDSMTVIHTYDGQKIRFYVMTDPDTNIQYIVNDRGGMCVRERDDAQ